jgi:hypothetical protein
VVFAATTALASISAHKASEQLAQTDTALGAIASSHFGHTTLIAQPGVVAKALYARDGSWLYVVTENAPLGAHVVLLNGSTAHDLGALGAGTPATLFARSPGHATQINVVVTGANGNVSVTISGVPGAHLVAHGAPVY